MVFRGMVNGMVNGVQVTLLLSVLRDALWCMNKYVPRVNNSGGKTNYLSV